MSRRINGDRIHFPFRVARYFPKTYDLAKWEFIKEYCRGISLDLGAHIGLFTVEMARLSNRVIAVEPTEDSYRFLQKTVRLNQISNATLMNMCATDTNGWVDFYETNNVASCLNSTSPSIATRSVKKKSFTIDSLQLPISFMKIDIEGGELKALEGAKQTLEFTKAISLEIHPIQLKSDSGNCEALHLLLSRYSPKYFKDGTRISSKEFVSYPTQAEYQIILGG